MFKYTLSFAYKHRVNRLWQKRFSFMRLQKFSFFNKISPYSMALESKVKSMRKRKLSPILNAHECQTNSPFLVPQEMYREHNGECGY